ncbi:hypothetical protein EVAR_62463_1 [Eumeta japonica]|uniref:Uncharacterized protein n=1 Tax=Eumeta variegata TaxID=151549 RepID=A0A4C1ZRS6_EUMVA|nr:hypothetical protein EVAR_62463_1 [Eumeta japonica]
MDEAVAVHAPRASTETLSRCGIGVIVVQDDTIFMVIFKEFVNKFRQTNGRVPITIQTFALCFVQSKLVAVLKVGRKAESRTEPKLESNPGPGPKLRMKLQPKMNVETIDTKDEGVHSWSMMVELRSVTIWVSRLQESRILPKNSCRLAASSLTPRHTIRQEEVLLFSLGAVANDNFPAYAEKLSAPDMKFIVEL